MKNLLMMAATINKVKSKPQSVNLESPIKVVLTERCAPVKACVKEKQHNSNNHREFNAMTPEHLKKLGELNQVLGQGAAKHEDIRQLTDILAEVNRPQFSLSPTKRLRSGHLIDEHDID